MPSPGNSTLSRFDSSMVRLWITVVVFDISVSAKSYLRGAFSPRRQLCYDYAPLTQHVVPTGGFMTRTVFRLLVLTCAVLGSCQLLCAQRSVSKDFPIYVNNN